MKDRTERTTARIALWLKRMKGSPPDTVGEGAEGGSGAKEVDDRIEASMPDREGAPAPGSPSGKDVGVKSQLSTEHEAMLLKESGITRQLAEERGYRTVTTKAELGRLGFGRSQQNVPALLIPIYDPTGEIVLYQSRPDTPRIKKGKPVKYETPGGERMALDVHPAMKEKLRDPSLPLLVTEGIKKGDALASRGLVAISLVGVWNWRGTNEHGGKTVLAAWEYVALEGRKVYVVYDSDVMENRQVYSALCRQKGFLESRKANVALIYLPPGEGGTKQGVDDYLAAGHSDEDLLSHATTELRRPPQEEGPSHPYRATPGGLVWERRTQDGAVPTLLTNFTATITADVIEDDGAEVWRSFEIEATLGARKQTFAVPAAKFVGMGWVTEHLGAGAIVQPGFGLKDHARTAIQALSGEIPERRSYAHTGWRKTEGGWVYLHAGGGIGPDGEVSALRVRLPGSLSKRELPEPPFGDELACAVRASLPLWELAPEGVVVPLFCSAYRSAMGETDFGIHLSGPTGEGKSELAALFQQHFGAGLDARNLTSWEGTENFIEGQAFQLKDQLMVLDDFAPTGGSHDVQRWHKKADRVLRAKGNAAGRGRMSRDLTLSPEKPPRALILSTGEDVPNGQSLRARMVTLELSPGQFDWSKLTDCQRDASEGLYAASMAGFVRWLAGRYEGVRRSLREERASLREAVSRGGQHRRTPAAVADLALGLRYFLLFASEVGAVEKREAEDLWSRGWRALREVAAEQGHHQAAGDPTRRFRELLGAAIASGTAHIAAPSGVHPQTPDAWGWRFYGGEWRPQGMRVGWLDGENLYLEPDAAFAAVKRQGQDSGDALTVTKRTLNKRLHERGLLQSKDSGRQVLTVRRTLEGSRKIVLHTASDFLVVSLAAPDQPDQKPKKQRGQAHDAPTPWSGERSETRPRPGQQADQAQNYPSNGRVTDEKRSGEQYGSDQEPDRNDPAGYAENEANGRVGRVSSNGSESDAGDRTLTISEVLSEIGKLGSEPGEQAEFYRRGEPVNRKAIEQMTKTILSRRGWQDGDWQRHAGVVEAALTHSIGCECHECL